jgi:hypothetical protein
VQNLGIPVGYRKGKKVKGEGAKGTPDNTKTLAFPGVRTCQRIAMVRRFQPMPFPRNAIALYSDPRSNLSTPDLSIDGGKVLP